MTRWLAPSIAARQFAVTRQTVYRWIEAGVFGTGVRRTPSGRWQVSSDAVSRVSDWMADENATNGTSGRVRLRHTAHIRVSL